VLDRLIDSERSSGGVQANQLGVFDVDAEAKSVAVGEHDAEFPPRPVHVSRDTVALRLSFLTPELGDASVMNMERLNALRIFCREPETVVGTQCAARAFLPCSLGRCTNLREVSVCGHARLNEFRPVLWQLMRLRCVVLAGPCDAASVPPVEDVRQRPPAVRLMRIGEHIV